MDQSPRTICWLIIATLLAALVLGLAQPLKRNNVIHLTRPERYVRIKPEAASEMRELLPK